MEWYLNLEHEKIAWQLEKIDQTNFRAMLTDWLNLELNKQNKSVDN